MLTSLLKLVNTFFENYPLEGLPSPNSQPEKKEKRKKKFTLALRSIRLGQEQRDAVTLVNGISGGASLFFLFGGHCHCVWSQEGGDLYLKLASLRVYNFCASNAGLPNDSRLTRLGRVVP